MKKNSIQEAWESYKESVRFDSYEITPCKQVKGDADNHFDEVICKIEEAEFWVLYGRNEVDKDDNGAWLTEARHLFDRPTKE